MSDRLSEASARSFARTSAAVSLGDSASENRIGSPVDQVLLLCFHYDPATGKYGFVIAGVLRLAALATVFALGGYLTLAFYREFRQSRFQGPKSKVTGLVAAQTPDS